MTLSQLLNSFESQSISIQIDHLLSQKNRSRVRKFLLLVGAASFVASLFGPDPIFDGIALLFFGLLIVAVSFEAFYNSNKFTDTFCEYTVALTLFDLEEGLLTKAFLRSLPGKILIFRLGISWAEIDKFLLTGSGGNFSENFNFSGDFLTFKDLSASIYEADKSLSSFFFSHAVSLDEFLGAAEWVGHEWSLDLKKERWWNRDSLLSIPSIGTGLDYGVAYELSKYGLPLEKGHDLSTIDLLDGYRKKEIGLLENILARNEEANALIIDDDESVIKNILLRFLKKVRSGNILPALKHKTIIELDWNLLVANSKQKTELEAEILKLFRGAEIAGNIIIYISNLPSFMTSARNMGVNLSSLLEEFLHSKSLQIISHATKTDFHYIIETNASLVRMFERLVPESGGLEASVSAVIEKVREIEGKNLKNGNKVYFSYPAILAIVESADRYITYGEMPGKAIDLLIEITPWALGKSLSIVSKNDVLIFISEKVGVATGEISSEEGNRLSMLEEILHKRIVGQDEAVFALGNALRRGRSGISNPKRPFASFLFLGPTGVGKTETSKALAQSFFGGEDKIIRFDMSEFNGADALPNLIGAISENRSGTLSAKIRDNPYGVLLVDEFEKASPDVRDLFLQILDEGIFTDALGNQVNCRNLIIIATSNAGSSLIWKMMEEGEDPNKNKQKIIDFLIEEQIYKPELINRFDGVIIFHPLRKSKLEKVAVLMFEKLSERIKKEKGIEIKMSEALLDYLVLSAKEDEFGARSINRLIQEKVEDLLAKKIIRGELKPGSIFEIKKEDLE